MGGTLDFRASPSLTNGVYDKLASVNSPYMSVTGEHRGCSDTTGSFDVKEIEFDTNNVPVSFWATFEQRCDGEVPSLTGEVPYNAHRPVILQAPGEVMGLRGQNLSFGVTATATNGGPVMLTAKGLPNGASLTDNGNNTATFSWVPTWDQIGNTNITVYGVDTLGNVGDFAIEVVVTPQNGTFYLQAESDPDMGSNDGQTFLFTLTDAVFQTDGNNENSVDVSVVDSNGTSHEVFFRAPQFNQLTVGIYSNAVWEQDTGLVTVQPLLSLSGSGLDCSGAPLGGNFE